MRLLIVGNPRPTHVGRHFLHAAQALGHEVELMDVNLASSGPVWWRRVCWHLFGHRPPRLGRFSREVAARCQVWRPDGVLVTGISPVDEPALRQINAAGIPVANFLTDDPWNAQHRAPWFMRALPHYRHVFTPRHANEGDLHAHGVKGVSWLPFAYAPEDHHPPLHVSAEERQRWSGLLAFIGGADHDRAAVVRQLARAGVPLGLWGGYWAGMPEFSAWAHGHADAETCRKIVASAGVNLGLVRKANRDGHSMRSYELPATGGSLLVEDTADHRLLFGQDESAALLFDSDESLVRQARRLLDMSPETRDGMAREARRRVTGGANTYADRLKSIDPLFSFLA